jgi:predicted aldo/keto reductase-like oxidoreductase
MKTNPINFYKEMKQIIKDTREKGGNIPGETSKMMEEYSVWMGQTEEFKKKYGLKTETDVRDAAIRFVLSNPDIHTVLPSFSNFDELGAYVALSGKKLQSNDVSMLNDYKKVLGHTYCRHACGICESACPHNIPINTIMRYNHYFEAQGREKHAMSKYAGLSKSNELPCEKCEGHCVPACPYNVPIQGLLMLAHQNLTLC